MIAPRTGVLYTPKLLGWATKLACFPFDEACEFRAEVRSRSCGSTVSISFDLDAMRHIDSLGLQATACAVGQAAAAIFASEASGRSATDIDFADMALARWLGGNGPVPGWPGIEALTGVLPHIGRHEAIRLPWRAALAALSKGGAQS